MNITDAAKELGITSKKLRDTAASCGIELAPKARTILDKDVKKIVAALKEAPASKKEEKPKKTPAKKAATKATAKAKEVKPAATKTVKPKATKAVPKKAPKTDDAPLIIETEPELPALDWEEDDVAFEVMQVEKELEKEIEESIRKKVSSTQKKQQLDKKLALAKEEAPQVAPRTGVVELGETVSVKEFAEKISVPVSKIIAVLLKNGVLATINHQIDFDTAAIVASEFQVEVKKTTRAFETDEIIKGNLKELLKEDGSGDFVTRPPIVSIMGHVDHGKTKLLDYIRKTDVVAGEAGGITQHIGAYQIDHNGKKITFLDTPGHEAFTTLRARGAQITDIVILVVAMDEGVKPQTIEAAHHAKDAGVQMIVALTKADKPNPQLDKIRGDLAALDIVSEEWGGTTPFIQVSGVTGLGVEDLLEMILLMAEMSDLKGNPKRPAIATVVETRLTQALGPQATVIINAGVLKVGDVVISGHVHGKIKALHDYAGRAVPEATISMPVVVSGLSELPQSGDLLHVVEHEKLARDITSEIRASQSIVKTSSIEDLVTSLGEGETKTLKVVVKADTKGTLEAITATLLKLSTEQIDVRIIHAGIGNVTETDVLMASASKAMMVAFGVDVPAQVKRIAEQYGVSVKVYAVIYHLFDDVKALLHGLVPKEMQEVIIGIFEVIKVFFHSRKFLILGGKVSSGKIDNRAQFRVQRGEEYLGIGTITSLQKGQETVSSIAEGHECGLRVESAVDILEGDKIEVFKMEEVSK